MKRFALIGEGISYSKSKVIHEAFFKVVGLEASYEIMDFAPSELEAKLAELRSLDGFNVTKPYKETIAQYLSKNEGVLGAVNTVVVGKGFMRGYNTDGAGFAYAVRGVDFADKNVLVLGAGGASRAICDEVIQKGGKLAILNRTRERAEKLVAEVGGELFQKSFNPHIIINTTTVGQQNKENPLPDFVDLCATEFIFDAIYRKTPLLRLAEEKGIRRMDGFIMLVAQAVYAECLFNRMKPMSTLINEVARLVREQRVK